MSQAVDKDPVATGAEAEAAIENRDGGESATIATKSHHDSAHTSPDSLSDPAAARSGSERSDDEEFFEASEHIAVAPPAQSASPQPTAPRAIPIAGVSRDDPLQEGVDLAMRAVSLFLNSDFKAIEKLLHHKRRTLLYASEGHAAIQYLRAMMTFSKEAMQDAQTAANNTINLATRFRKPRGVGAMLSASASRETSRGTSPKSVSGSPASASGHRHKKSHGESHSSSRTSVTEPEKLSRKNSERHRRFHIDSPRLTLRSKKNKEVSKMREGSVSMPGAIPDSRHAKDAKLLDSAMLAEKLGDLDSMGYESEDSAATASLNGAESAPEERLDGPAHRSWMSGITGVADSLIGIVRSGTQAVGISKPDWYALRSMTPTQRHAELVHAEAYLLRAMLNIATSGGAMSFLKEGWHVKSAYATYRDCYSYIQAEYEEGNMVDDHFVSGTYLGMGVFNLILSMLPARLLRFIEFVGFSADRKLGLELLAIAAGWRSDPGIKTLMGPPPNLTSSKGSTAIHPCGYGLRSEFCSIVLQMYHTMFCYDLYLGYPNLPLVEKVIGRSITQYPQSLIFMYFNGRSRVIHTDLVTAIDIFDRLIDSVRTSVPKSTIPELVATADTATANSIPALVQELSQLSVNDVPDEQLPTPASVANDDTPSDNDWRQLQYLGYWERSLCHMSLGRWLEAAQDFNTLRTENNWNKAVYTYGLAVCLWEHYLVQCGGTAPIDTAELTHEQHATFKVVRSLMKTVPTLKRRVAGKSIPIEKYMVRKAYKFAEQGCFLQRPGLELNHVWALYGKMPRERLVALREEVDRDIAHMAEFVPTQRAPENPYRHIFYYDDLAVLLLTKGCILRELAIPTFLSSASQVLKGALATTAVSDPAKFYSPEIAPIAEDTLLRLLRLMPLIQRDHNLAVQARFHLANLHLAFKGQDKKRREWAKWQYKCILGGRPLSSSPCMAFDEYHAIIADVSELTRDTKETHSAKIFAAPTCLTEEMLLEGSGHSSLKFFDGNSEMLDWRWTPPYWTDSKKYSLQNVTEIRTFNAESRLKELLAAR